MYWCFKKLIYVSIENPIKTINKVKGIFKPFKCCFKYSFKKWDYYPVLWCSKPLPIQIMFRDVMWKDKNDSPQYEVCPYIWIHLYKLNLIWYWLPPADYKEVEDFWEQVLWYLYYSNKNINKAKETWPWRDYITKESTWNDKFLIK